MKKNDQIAVRLGNLAEDFDHGIDAMGAVLSMKLNRSSVTRALITHWVGDTVAGRLRTLKSAVSQRYDDALESAEQAEADALARAVDLAQLEVDSQDGKLPRRKSRGA